MKARKTSCFIISIIALFVFAFAPHAEEVWEIVNYLDEFGNETGNRFVGNSELIYGGFSNSAVTNSPLSVWLLVDENRFAVKLLEYGSRLVKNATSNKEEYEITMLDSSGEKHQMKGWLYAGGDRIYIDDKNVFEALTVMRENDTVSFLIKESERPICTYRFEADTEGFKAKHNEYIFSDDETEAETEEETTELEGYFIKTPERFSLETANPEHGFNVYKNEEDSLYVFAFPDESEEEYKKHVEDDMTKEGNLIYQTDLEAENDRTVKYFVLEYEDHMAYSALCRIDDVTFKFSIEKENSDNFEDLFRTLSGNIEKSAEKAVE